MIDKLINSKIAVHCKTEIEAKILMEIFNSHGITWHGGMPMVRHNVWNRHKEKTCYEITGGHASYTNLGYFTRNGWKIIKFKDLVKEDYNESN